MKPIVSKPARIGALTLAISLAATAYAADDQSIPDDTLGLSKTSVYDVPAPEIVVYSDKSVGTVGRRAPRSYPTAPPMIPHTIQDMVPITRESNLCRDCHAQPGLIGARLEPGMPVPVPKSHYVNFKRGQLHQGRHTCTQCHAPQADVKLLVDSMFGHKAARR